jgi:hypothetical protein
MRTSHGSNRAGRVLEAVVVGIVLLTVWGSTPPVRAETLSAAFERLNEAADRPAIWRGPARQLQEQGAGEGPAWDPKLGLLTSGGGHVFRRDLEGNLSIFLRDAGFQRTSI